MSAAAPTPESRLAAFGNVLPIALLAFGTYFCMYAFRKPFAAAGYAGPLLFGVELKTAYILAQVIGYAASKLIGIKVGAESNKSRRLRLLLGLVLGAQLALVAFALLPQPLKPLAMLLNGLPLGMVWGLVVRYLEGRRSTDALLAGLSASFIVASGFVKDAGRWLLNDVGVNEYWMPALVGLLFLGPFALLARLLHGTPEPSVADRAARAPRTEMSGPERRSFVARTWPGLCALLLTYLALTAFRDYRDNFGVELFAELGVNERGAFTRTEVPVALVVVLSVGLLGIFQRPLSGLIATFSVMLAGLATIGGASLLYDAGLLGPRAWMIAIGIGVYLAYVPASSFLFDRIMAATRFAGTAVFAINLADAVGYFGSVGLQLYKDLAAASSTRYGFFRDVCYALCIGGSLLLCFSAVYFVRLGRRNQPPE
jgi:hypothetical protein